YPGSYAADLLLQGFGLAAFLFPILALLLAWKWLRSESFQAPAAKLIGAIAFLLGSAAALPFGPGWRLFRGATRLGGVMGLVVEDALIGWLNTTGAILADATILIVAIYLISSFTVEKFVKFLMPLVRAISSLMDRWGTWKADSARRRKEKLAERLAKAREAQARRTAAPAQPEIRHEPEPQVAMEQHPEPEPEIEPEAPEIPIRTLEDPPPWEAASAPTPPPAPETKPAKQGARHMVFHLPETSLLNEPPARSEFDEQELKNIAVRVKSKFEEFNVFGSVVQINPGPVVTTFEFKPDAGIKYSRMTTLTEDLCLGLQAESILIERIPGKPTVGIEVPNTKRDVISLRQILESD